MAEGLIGMRVPRNVQVPVVLKVPLRWPMAMTDGAAEHGHRSTEHIARPPCWNCPKAVPVVDGLAQRKELPKHLRHIHQSAVLENYSKDRRLTPSEGGGVPMPDS